MQINTRFCRCISETVSFVTINDELPPLASRLQEVFQEYSNLTESSLSAECLLAMKIASARALTKDLSDSIFLMKLGDIQSEDELFAIITKYMDEKRLTAAVRFFTLEAFEQYRRSSDML